MKQVLIHWHRCDPYERRHERKAAIRNAQRSIRQQTKLQLKKYSGNLDTINYSIFPVEWYETGEWDSSVVDYFDDFIQPTVRLGYFD